MLIKKIPDTIGLVTTVFLNTKISQVENKTPDTSNLVTTKVLNTKTNDYNFFLGRIHFTSNDGSQNSFFIN